MQKQIIILILSVLVGFNVNSQSALTNSGGRIQVFGSGVPSTKLTLAVLGSFENQNDGVNDGTIDLQDEGHLYVSGDWTNNSFSNVFPPSSASLTDGLVTLQNPTTNQIIGGITPTFFENLALIDSRKILVNDLNSVNNTLHLAAPLILNSRTIEFKKQDPNAINYISGFIKSETQLGNHGFIKWNTGSYVGTFTIPFGSDNYFADDDLSFSINLKNPMAVSDFFNFATYHSDIYNLPLPASASPLEIEARKVVDRYWIINPSDKNNMPEVNISFSYSAIDISNASNSLDPDRLLASRNNTSLGKWLDMEPRGTNNLNTVEIKDVTPMEFYPIWTLVNMPPALTNLFTPDAFSPNGDGLNDVFIPVFQVDFEVIDYQFIIYDRWGRIVFQTKDLNEGWTGDFKGVTSEPIIGVYSWVIIVKGRNHNSLDADGQKRKFTGKVTLVL